MPLVRSSVVSSVLALGLLATAALQPAAAGNIWFTGGEAAVRGYDTVAYFTEGRPVEGKRKFAHRWMDTEWRFASAVNRDLFAAKPEKYAPQYGGWCAWAVANGYTASTDPHAWKIVDGRLYLNYSKSVQRQWNGNIPDHVARGDRNWPGIKKNLAAK